MPLTLFVFLYFELVLPTCDCLSGAGTSVKPRTSLLGNQRDTESTVLGNQQSKLDVVHIKHRKNNDVVVCKYLKTIQ
eukprot:3341635-Amphidinium_carterae.1